MQNILRKITVATFIVCGFIILGGMMFYLQLKPPPAPPIGHYHKHDNIAVFHLTSEKFIGKKIAKLERKSDYDGAETLKIIFDDGSAMTVTSMSYKDECVTWLKVQ